VRISVVSVHAAEAPARAAGPAHAMEMAGGAAAVAPAAPATSAGTSRKRKHAFSSSRSKIVFSRGCVSVRRESDSLFASPQGGANCASPRTGQGAEGRCVRPYPAAFVKGAAGGGERSSNGEREFAGCS
jgi:hypothetical protein